MAYTLTELIHSKEDADKALKTSERTFRRQWCKQRYNAEFKLTDDKFTDGKTGVLDLLAATKLASSKSEARRLVTQGGVIVNDEKVTDIEKAYAKEEFTDKFVIRKGKKIFLKVTV